MFLNLVYEIGEKIAKLQKCEAFQGKTVKCPDLAGVVLTYILGKKPLMYALSTEIYK